eukprot:scaffold198647_cov23-Cyclotella_meneghiniana.AAC.1
MNHDGDDNDITTATLAREGGGTVHNVDEDVVVFDDEVNFDDCFNRDDDDNIMSNDLGECNDVEEMPNVDSFQSCKSREEVDATTDLNMATDNNNAVTLLARQVTVDSFKSCNSAEMMDATANATAAEPITKSGDSLGVKSFMMGRDEQPNNIAADAELLELSNRSTDASVISSGPIDEQPINLDDAEPDGPTLDVKLRRRQKIASMKASGRLNLPSKSCVSTADTEDTNANNAVDQLVNDERETFVDDSSMTQQTRSETFTHATNEDDQMINYLVNSIDESTLSNNAVDNRPKAAAPVDPKLKRRHKMASRVASGKVNVPKSFLSAAATSANVTSGEGELDNKPSITALTLEQGVELKASLNG